MDKIKKIIIHIGLHKTGTTSIQNTLFFNKKVLDKNNITYYGKLYPNNSAPLYSAFCKKPELYYNNVLSKIGGERLVAYNTYIKKSIKKVINQDDNILLFSGEDISVLSEDSLRKMFDYFREASDLPVEFEIICYVRNHISRFSSQYQEIIKSGQKINNIEAMVNATITQNFIQKFINILGKDSIKVYKYESAVSDKNSIVGHFFKSIKVYDKYEDEEYLKYSNERLSYIAIDLLEMINKEKPAILKGKINPNACDSKSIKNIKAIKGTKYYYNEQNIFDKYNYLIINDLEWLKNTFNIDLYGEYDYALEGAKLKHRGYSKYSVMKCFLLSDTYTKNIMIKYFKKQDDPIWLELELIVNKYGNNSKIKLLPLYANELKEIKTIDDIRIGNYTTKTYSKIHFSKLGLRNYSKIFYITRVAPKVKRIIRSDIDMN